jgi:DNA-binding transcriptional regulator YhcF (GntR family)
VTVSSSVTLDQKEAPKTSVSELPPTTLATSEERKRGRIAPFPMKISLSKNSDVPLRQQLAEQIVFLITTGQLRAGQQMPSVRALARRVKVHHNTVSEAYQDLVRRNWLTRQRGSRLIVGAHAGPGQKSPTSLDELINETIQRAKRMGYSLQALTECVRDRLLAEPPDHFLVVEEEPGLREIIRHEVQEKLGWPVESCSPEQFAKEPGLAVGAQVFAPNHIIEELEPLVPQNRPSVSITYSGADEHVDLIRSLKKPSIIAAVSISESLLKTARSLFAPAIGRRHTFREFLLPQSERIELPGVDVAFCDSLAMPAINCRRKIHYRLVAPNCFEYLAAAVEPARRE